MAISWDTIDTVLLDLDGTLLDLRFDNHFWLEHVPRRYAEARGLLLEEAKRELKARYQAMEGRLEWYSVDFWTVELGLDIAALKEEVQHLIAPHPHAVDFLQRTIAAGRRAIVVTNAHPKSIRLKMRRTRLDAHVDRIICAHTLGFPKETVEFWRRFAEVEPFDADRTLLVEDSIAVLRTARAVGVRHLLAVRRPDSGEPERSITEFDSISSFAEL